MIMIPLHFLVTIGAILFALREFFETPSGERNRFLIAFLLVLALQAAIIGIRFGYGQEWLREFQPISASILPPLAFLSFRERLGFPKVLIHFLPPIIVVVITLFALSLLDAYLALNNLVYGLLLARIGLKGSDGLSWAGLNRARNWLVTLWLIVALLVYSGITDSVIAMDFYLTDGQNTSRLVGIASAAGLFANIIIALYVLVKARREKGGGRPQPGDTEKAVFEKVDHFLREEKLYLDPDLNLNRIARRLILPARDVSRAINALTAQNVSQYVNGLRIEAACQLMKREGLSVTNAIYASGFNTKSNFNREFLRVTGKTPSEWKRSNDSI